MDGALFSLLFFFFVQISAGVAPLRWPQCKWLAGVIFWISTAGATTCLIWYGYHQDWITLAIEMLGRQTFGVLVLIFGTVVGVIGLSIFASDSPKKTSPAIPDIFTLGRTILLESRSIKTTDGVDTKLYETKFYIVVSNASEDGRTLRNVQAEIVGYETPVVAPMRGSSLDRIDLKDGQAAFFLIGRTVGTDFLGNFVGDAIYIYIYAPDRLRRYDRTIAASRKPTFEIWSFDNVYRYGLNDDKEKTNWGLWVVISADDKKSKRIALKVTPSDQIPINYAEGK
jgi:hypothetical protein